jgi:GNAT superfamily N-acetyltransferase
MKGWGIPGDDAWPYDGRAESWPPREPPKIDSIAKMNRIGAYERIRSIDDCRRLLAARRPVVVSVEIDSSWYECVGGRISRPTGQTIIASHTVCVVGYDDRLQHLIFQNSWGTTWGDEGFGYMPYEYLDQRLVEGFFILAIDETAHPRPQRAVIVRGWGIADPLGTVFHCAEIIDGARDEMIGWTFAVERDGALEVEDLFVRPRWRLLGYGGTLVSEMQAIASRLGLQIRVWISHADAAPSNCAAIDAVVRRLGVALETSPVSWASLVGEQRDTSGECLGARIPPARPAASGVSAVAGHERMRPTRACEKGK